MFDPANAEDLQARIDVLPDDIAITVRVGALRAVMAELRFAADEEIEAWMQAAGAHPSTAILVDEEFGLVMDPCEHPSVNGGICAACSAVVP